MALFRLGKIELNITITCAALIFSIVLLEGCRKVNPHSEAIKKLALLETQLEVGADWQRETVPLLTEIEAEFKVHPLTGNAAAWAALLFASASSVKLERAMRAEFMARNGWDPWDSPVSPQKSKVLRDSYQKQLTGLHDEAARLRQSLTENK